MDFPFGGHGTIDENFDALADVAADGSMPPFRYRIMHWSAALSESEVARVNQWISSASERLKSVP